MNKITSLDLRSTTLRRAAQREICVIVKSLVPEIVLLTHNDAKWSYEERIGLLGHFTRLPFFLKHNL